MSHLGQQSQGTSVSVLASLCQLIQFDFSVVITVVNNLIMSKYCILEIIFVKSKIKSIVI